MYFRMQGLHASSIISGESGVVRSFGNRQAFICQQASGAAGGRQLDTTSERLRGIRRYRPCPETLSRRKLAADWTTLLHGIKSRGFEHYEGVR